MVKRSEVHALIDTGSLTEADIPAVLRSVAPEVTALRSMSSKTDPEAVLLDCYDITRLLIRLCALSTSMKTCTSSGKILADIVARMPCSYRCAAMFRDLGAAVSTALRGQKDLQTGGNYTHQIALMDVSANYHCVIGPLTGHAALSVAMMWCSALHSIVMAPVISSGCSRELLGGAWGRLAVDVMGGVLGCGLAPPRCVAVLAALGTSLLDRRIVSAPVQFRSMLDVFLQWSGDMCLRAVAAEGPAAVAGGARGAQAVGQLLEHAAGHAELRSVCIDAVYTFLSVSVRPVASRSVLDSPRPTPPAFSAVAADGAADGDAAVRESEAAPAAGRNQLAEVLAFELGSRTIKLNPLGFIEHDLWDLFVLSPRLFATFQNEFVVDRGDNNFMDLFTLHELHGLELSAILKNHVSIYADIVDSVGAQSSKRRRLESGRRQRGGDEDEEGAGEEGERQARLEPSDVAQLFRREAQELSTSLWAKKSRLALDVLVGMAEYFDTFHNIDTPNRCYAITNLLVKTAVLLQVAAPREGMASPESHGLAESAFMEITLYSLVTLLCACLDTSPRQVSSSARLDAIGVGLNSVAFVVPKLIKSSFEKSEPIALCIRALAKLVHCRFVELFHAASRLLTELSHSGSNVMDMKVRWLGVLAIPGSFCCCELSTDCPYLPMLPAMVSRLGPDDGLLALTASLKTLSHAWVREADDAAFQDLQRSVSWIFNKISSALKGTSLKDNISNISMAFTAISDFHLGFIAASATHAPRAVDDRIREVCGQHAIGRAYSVENGSGRPSLSLLAWLGKSVIIDAFVALRSLESPEKIKATNWYREYTLKSRGLMPALDPVVRLASALVDSDFGDSASKSDAVEKLVVPLINMLTSSICVMHAHVFADGADSDSRGCQDMQDMIGTIINRLVVMPKLSYRAAMNVADMLALVMCSESSIEALRPSHTSAVSSGPRILETVSHLLGDAAREAVATADEEDDRNGGVDARHVLLIVLSRAHSLFVRHAALFAPKASIICLERMVHTISLFGGTTWHWGYQVLMEDINSLARNKAALVSEGSPPFPGLAHQTLAAYPPLAAELFFKPFLRLPPDRQEDVAQLLCGLTAKEFVGPFVGPLLSLAIVSTEATLFRSIAKLNQGWVFQQNLAGAFDSTLMSLLERNPTLLLDILMSDSMQRSDENLVISNALPQRLLELARVLKLSGSFDLRTARPAGGRVLQRVLVQSAWDLGAKDRARRDAAVRALRVVSVMYATQSWTGGSFDENCDGNPWFNIKDSDGAHVDRTKVRDAKQYRRMGIDSFVADIIPMHFLFIMSNLIQKNWSYQSYHRQAHAVRSIAQLVRLSRSDAILQFLPKIVVALDAALASKSLEVKISGVELVQELSMKLPTDVLQSNLAYFVVGLLPIAEAESYLSASEGDADIDRDFQKNTIRDLNQYLSVLSTQSHLPPIDCHANPTILGSIVEYIGGSSADYSHRALALDFSKRVINEMVAKCSSSDDALRSIPYFPEDCQGLAEVASRRREALSALTPADIMRRLCAALIHDSAQVRLYSLKQMLKILRSTGKSLIDATVSGSGDNAVISFIVRELLLLFSRENDESVRDLCAQSLGEIGAFDPSRVSVRLHSSQSADADTHSAGLSKPPWAHSVWTFGLAILQSHLIPALKAANGAGDVMAQDFSSVAIQEVLQILAGDEIGAGSASDAKSMPPKLTKALKDYGILDICDPFWNTRYNLLFTQRDYTPELYTLCDSFPVWISSWCLQLICCSRTPLHPLFRACRGVLRYRPQIGQFLLPYLIVDGVISASATARGIYDFVLDEIDGILKAITEIQNRDYDSSNESLIKLWSLEHRQLAVQTIFSLLDRFELWLQVKQAEASSHSSSRSLSEAEVKLERDVCDRIVNGFLTDISKEVLGRAALGINAFARSIRYLEAGARGTREAKSSKPEAGATGGRRYNDGANGQLPTLSKNLVDAMSVIFAKLDDNDALSGVEKLRYVYGIPSSPWNRIVELQHSERWLEALGEYSSLKGEAPSNSDIVRSCAASSMAESPIATQEHLSSGYIPNSPDKSSKGRVLSEHGPNIDRHTVDVQRGKMRCLMQLGHEELVMESCRSLIEVDPAGFLELQDLGVEAAWRLQQWDDLDTMTAMKTAQPRPSSRQSLVDPFVVHSGKLFNNILKQDNQGFQACMKEARMNVSSFLAAASMESYSRCYPGLVRLHILRELEQGMEMAFAAASRLGSDSGHAFVEECIGDEGYRWSQRISVISSSTKHRDEVLSIRRAIFGLLRDPISVANLWLQSSEALRLSGRFDSALNSLRKAESFGLGAEAALLEQCRILKGNGNVRKALLLLEPDEALMNELKIRAFQTPKQPMDLSPTGLEPQQLAMRLHLSTQWMVEHKLAHGREILDRLKVIVYLSRDWETALFYFAKYNDELFESKLKDLLKRGASPSDDDKAMYQFAVAALESYGKAIKVGNEFLMQSMPQFLSVFFSFMGLVQQPRTASSRLAVTQHNMGKFAARCAQDIPACKWYTCTPQIASRIGHHNPEAIKTVKLLLLNILIDFPEQGIWHVCSLLHSLNSERRATGKVLIREAAAELERLKRHTSSTMLQESIVMFSSLVDLAQAQTKDRRIRWSIGADLELSNFLVPSQAALSIAFPESSELAASWTYFPSAKARIASFDNVVEVMMTKAKPKKITLTTTTGATVRFLLKQEKHGDLRKDARLMEFNSVVNRLLKESPDSRKRNLRLRTFCVVCLNEESGLMEWVPDTACLRALVMESHSGVQDRFPVLDLRKVRDVVDELHNKYCETNIDQLLAEYKRLVLDQYRPCFHRWFLQRFVDPTEWIESRDMFTRSAAVWAAVGHIVGLGDRHGDNILIDTQLGECVHVDFDCLFDKGLKLQRPEIVPFRLTPCMVDAMGLTGYEGVFRHSMEACMQVLRDNKGLLIGVLKPFIQDPTVAWGRGGRAQQRIDLSAKQPTAGNAASVLDSENKDAEEALRMITERLNGIYNIYHPKAARIIQSYKAQGLALPKMGLGASQEDAVPEPLSVEGQVDRLIVEATAEINLAQMYHGWMPWS